MGHVRLGRLVRSKVWKEVVELIASGADVTQVANATIRAADKAFNCVKHDKGFNEAVYLMTQLAIAAGKDNFVDHLKSVGIDLPSHTSLPNVAATISDALDRKIDTNGKRSDLGEMAQRALVSAVVDHITPKLPTLFSSTTEDVKASLGTLNKKQEFGQLSRSFFAKLTTESMNYFLSKTLATHLGEGQRFPTMNQMAQFESALQTHCMEASRIVEQFSADWFSKHRYEEGGDISRESTKGFASYAMKKMKDELKEGAKSDAR